MLFFGISELSGLIFLNISQIPKQLRKFVESYFTLIAIIENIIILQTISGDIYIGNVDYLKFWAHRFLGCHIHLVYWLRNKYHRLAMFARHVILHNKIPKFSFIINKSHHFLLCYTQYKSVIGLKM